MAYAANVIILDPWTRDQKWAPKESNSIVCKIPSIQLILFKFLQYISDHSGKRNA
jgi:hypothetical protein